MELLKTATDWAKAEVFSSSFFILFGLLFMVLSLCFWHFGKTEIARAYIVPASVAGGLLLIIGVGLVYANQTRITDFEKAYHEDASAFVASELNRAEGTLQEYKTVAFTAIPILLAACALLLLFMNPPQWRASLISAMAMLVVILLIDGTAQGRIKTYHEQLKQMEKSQLAPSTEKMPFSNKQHGS